MPQGKSAEFCGKGNMHSKPIEIFLVNISKRAYVCYKTQAHFCRNASMFKVKHKYVPAGYFFRKSARIGEKQSMSKPASRHLQP